MSQRRRRLLGGLALAPFATRVLAQGGTAKPPAGRRSEQDVPWVPTPDEIVVEMMRLARVKPGDVVCDLGSGDGRIPIIAARQFKARGLGVEIDPELVASSRRKIREAGVADRVRIIEGDVLEADFSEATVITLYLLTFLNDKLRPRLLALKPGTRIVAHNYGMTDWDADEVLFYNETRALLWYVPAPLGGTWRLRTAAPAWSVPITLTLTQSYQRLAGEAFFGDEGRRIRDAEVRGDRVRMTLLDPASGAAWTFTAQWSTTRRGPVLHGFLTDGRALHRVTGTPG